MHDLEPDEEDLPEDDSAPPSDDKPVVLNPRAGFFPPTVSDAVEEKIAQPDVREDDSATG